MKTEERKYNVHIQPITTGFVVILRELRFDSIRQETYWVTTGAKHFATESAAKKFEERMQTPAQYKRFIGEQPWPSTN